jgi:ATP-dependent DNA helicase DinG
VSERAWRQVSVSAHECLGGTCPMVTECFVERSRAAAADVDVIVTNHSFMAIDSFEGRQMLPEHDLLVVDEAHELVDRVTSTITDELTSGMITGRRQGAGKRSRAGDEAEARPTCSTVLEPAAGGPPDWRSPTRSPGPGRVRDTPGPCRASSSRAGGSEADGALQVARAAVDEVFENAAASSRAASSTSSG